MARLSGLAWTPKAQTLQPDGLGSNVDLTSSKLHNPLTVYLASCKMMITVLTSQLY